MPATELALKMSLTNIDPGDMVVIAYGGNRIRDAILIGMAFERLGLSRFAVLHGGMGKWIAEGRTLSTDLPEEGKSEYPIPNSPDTFTVDYRMMEDFTRKDSAVILDVRAGDYFSGQKSDEAREETFPARLTVIFQWI
jgi:thiosulfate/3-mercaptopyruvate sulfurtransferase